MGTGIAMAMLNAGIPVKLMEQNQKVRNAGIKCRVPLCLMVNMKIKDIEVDMFLCVLLFIMNDIWPNRSNGHPLVMLEINILSVNHLPVTSSY